MEEARQQGQVSLPKVILPDVLQRGLRVVFCGTAAGRASEKAQSYYAHGRNKFWSVLSETGLTDRKLAPHEFREVTRFGIGLTDLCKDLAGSDHEVRPRPEHRVVLRRKIEENRPDFLAFTSLEAAKRFVGRRVGLGRYEESIGTTSIYVLPSTSPMADWNWMSNKIHWWEFAERVRAS